MTRRRLTRAAAGAVAAALCLVWGETSLRAATPLATPLSQADLTLPSINFEVGSETVGTLPRSGDVLGSSAGVIGANATEGVAAIPLPPSAYPGMVGLATAALSVWRYRRRRR